MMSQSWLSASEITLGRIIEGREKNIRKYQATWFYPPYDDGFQKLVDGGTNEDVMAAISPASYQAAVLASKKMNGSGDSVDWSDVLHRAYKANEVADKFERVAKQLRNGRNDVDVIPAIELAKDLINPNLSGLVNAADVDWENYTELMPLGWKPWDEMFGGIPRAAPILLGGETGRGKSFFAMKFAFEFMKTYPNKKVLVYTLEMPSAQWIARGVKVYGKKFLSVIETGRLLITADKTTIRDISVQAASTENVGLIIVDYVDYLVSSRTEDEYAGVYMGMNEICRTLEIPFLMLVQPNRNQYTEPIPRAHHIRYSGMAENVASQLVMLWKPPHAFDALDNYDELERQAGFVFEQDHFYLVCWKNRAGWVDEYPGPGAVVLKPSKEIFGDDGYWQQYGAVPINLSKLSKMKGKR